jgi:uncharacterized SAM-binding protein YcdF (DUF218 family)
MAAAAKSEKPKRSKPVHGFFYLFVRRMAIFALLFVIGWFVWVHHEIKITSEIDNAQPADAIAVFGAAEYGGRPSPVLHARLDKAVALYQHGIAPIIITLGGGTDKDNGNTEGAVGRDYLLANGVPLKNIIAETTSIDTEQQVDRLAAIARQYHFQRLVVVSDGTHLFRIQLLCSRAGLNVYTSPRAQFGNLDYYDATKRMAHEMISYTALALNLHISWLHRYIEGKAD